LTTIHNSPSSLIVFGAQQVENLSQEHDCFNSTNSFDS